MKVTVKGRFWIETEKGPLIGMGRYKLLKLVGETGSIQEAAREMQMSYKQAWTQVQSLNTNYKEPLVEKKSGGKNGGGTVLTEAGVLLIKKYERIIKETEAFLKQQTKELNKL